jgi:hypothetical protein
MIYDASVHTEQNVDTLAAAPRHAVGDQNAIWPVTAIFSRASA